MVISDHIDIILQIRQEIKTMQTKIKLIHVQPPKLEMMEQATKEEKLVHKMHKKALTYYHTKSFRAPLNHSPLFPGQQICITHQNKPVVANISKFLQDTEREIDREEYFFEKMHILPDSLSNVDQFALGRVIKKNKSRHAIYSKIIHRQLNTMTVNETWNLGKSQCPICCVKKEDWLHVVQCNAPSQKSHRELFLVELESKLEEHRTYPPLAQLLYGVFADTTFETPEEPIIANPTFTLIFQRAFQEQNGIGWQNLARGFVSKSWKGVQYEYYRKIKWKDIHAVDKWSRMIITTILEFHRTMWGLRCKLVAEEKTETYEARQRLDILRIYQYLKQTPQELPDTAHHYLDKEESFFHNSPLDTILMWKRGVKSSIDIPIIHKTKSIKRFFKKQRTAPKQKKKSKLKSSAPKFKRQKISKTKKDTKKRKKIQHSLQRHFPKPPQDIAEDEKEEHESPTVKEPPQKRRKITKSSEKMLTYRKRLQAFKNITEKNTSEGGFKRHIEVSPEYVSSTGVPNSHTKKKRYAHRNNPSFLPTGHS